MALAQLHRELAAHLVGDEEPWRDELPTWMARLLWDASCWHAQEADHHARKADVTGSST